MSIHIANQISSRLRAKNISVAALEREAGLTNHSVRNILRGKSKRPSAETMLAVADVLGCSIQDLMVKEVFFESTSYSGKKQEILKASYEPTGLMQATVKLIEQKLQEKGKTLTLKQFLNCVEEVYIHSLQKGGSVDKAYADWFVNLVEG